jgi:hypothetical protein
MANPDGLEVKHRAFFAKKINPLHPFFQQNRTYKGLFSRLIGKKEPRYRGIVHHLGLRAYAFFFNKPFFLFFLGDFARSTFVLSMTKRERYRECARVVDQRFATFHEIIRETAAVQTSIAVFFYLYGFQAIKKAGALFCRKKERAYRFPTYLHSR